MDNFNATELKRALKEQRFGTMAFRIDEGATVDGAAVAFIQLLEQREIRVKLSNSGYQMINEAMADSEQTQVFETLDDLLLSISPKYGERRTEELMNRLSQLANISS